VSQRDAQISRSIDAALRAQTGLGAAFEAARAAMARQLDGPSMFRAAAAAMQAAQITQGSIIVEAFDRMRANLEQLDSGATSQLVADAHVMTSIVEVSGTAAEGDLLGAIERLTLGVDRLNSSVEQLGGSFETARGQDARARLAAYLAVLLTLLTLLRDVTGFELTGDAAAPTTKPQAVVEHQEDAPAGDIERLVDERIRELLEDGLLRELLSEDDEEPGDC
jgi:hypothetical protein